MLSSMPCDERRIRRITERAQGNLKGEVLKCRVMIDNKSKGKKRGPYRKKVRVTGDRSILSRETKTMEVDGESYVVLGSGNLLPNDWFGIFGWFQGGKAPTDWLNRFNMTAPSNFSEVDQLNEHNSRVL